MGNLHLVTGYAGKPHVMASDIASAFEAAIRGGQYVMVAGENFSASAITNNKVRVKDGELMIQGRHIKLESGSHIDVSIDNGAQGVNRNDLIVARYHRDRSSGIESCNLHVIKGTATYGTASDPSVITGNINDGQTETNDFALHRVVLSGVNIVSVVPLFSPQESLFESAIKKTGGTMLGPLSMGGKRLSGLQEPAHDDDAVPLGFAQNNFAPSNFGYGGVMPQIMASDDTDGSKFNAQADTFLLSMADNSVKQVVISDNPAITNVNYVATIYKLSSSFVVIDAVSYAGIHVLKEKRDGVWGPWEWMNPYLIIGVEYATTEKWQGKIVYTKLLNFGAIPYNNIASVRHGAAATKMIRCVGQRAQGNTLPMAYQSIRIDIHANENSVWINTIGMTGAFSDTATVQIWYTKD